MKYNIIGDIHGRTNWKQLVQDNCINIFVGDYFSPYDKNISFEEQRNNFMDIIMYKEEHPETVLLIGNHDIDHWYIKEKYSRFDAEHYNEIYEIFEENKDLLQVAYSINNKVLVTHAGVSTVWHEKYKYNSKFVSIIDCNYDDDDYFIDLYTEKPVKKQNAVKFSTVESPEDAYDLYYKAYHSYYANDAIKPVQGKLMVFHNKIWRYNGSEFEEIKETPDSICDFINELWNNKKYNAFNFHDNKSYYDYYGDDEKHGPMWIRPESLDNANIFKYTNFTQVVGHTQYPDISCLTNKYIEMLDKANYDKDTKGKIMFVDCLGYNTESLIYNDETDNFSINC